MTTASLPISRAEPSLAARLAAAGVSVAVLDGLLALAVGSWWRGAPPARVFQGIASVLIGPGALTGGARTAVLGLALHLVVATGWSVVFLAAYRWLPALRRLAARPGGPWRVGAAYGAFVWAMMNFVVIPVALWRAPRVPPRLDVAAVVLLGHMLLVGPPIVALLRRRGLDERA